MKILALFALLLCSMNASAQNLFSEVERKKVVDFWKAPDRYVIALPAEAAQKGPWQVRLTPEGSVWLLKYQIATGRGGAPPTADPTSSPRTNVGVAGWKDWVLAKVACDRWFAQTLVDSANAHYVETTIRKSFETLKPLKKPATGDKPALIPEPPALGTIPTSLMLAVGSPPSLANAVIVKEHTIRFDEGDSYVYRDNVNFSPTYGYYRFPQGVAHEGTPLVDEERNNLFKAAGLSETEQHVMQKVSKLEGSFDAVNTYDTGYVSIGFIQFASLLDGKQSLSSVLIQEKRANLPEFEKDFRRFGIDVSPIGVMTVLDPATGKELDGTDAVLKIVDEKRLVAVFQKAGKLSSAFRIAQIMVAKSTYWAGEDPIEITLNGSKLTGKISDVIKSEAGLATLFDRKVNRGTINPFPDVLLAIMKKNNLKTVADACKFEKEIVTQMKYRVDFLADKDLTQPGMTLAEVTPPVIDPPPPPPL